MFFSFTITFSQVKLPATKKFRHLSIEQGLSQSTVNCILQSKNGLIWLGTADGLNVYDGNIFKQYKSEPNDSNSLSAPYIDGLFEDKYEKIWISTYGGGLNIFSPVTEKFEIYKHNPSDSNSISSNRVKTVCHESANKYWIATFGGGLNIFDYAGKKFRRIVFETDSLYKNSQYIIKMIHANDGHFYLATKSGLYVLDKEEKIVKKFQHNPNDPSSLADNRLQDVYEDSKGYIWISTFNAGLYRLDPSSGDLKNFRHEEGNPNSLSGDFVNCVIEDSKGLIWIGTQNDGISVYNPTSKRFQSIQKNTEDPYSLNAQTIQCFYEDKQNLLWVGTNGGGVNLYHDRFSWFSSIPIDSKKLDRKEDLNVYAITTDDSGAVWLGSLGSGLWKYNSLTGQKINYAEHKTKNNGVADNNIMAVCNVSNTTLLAGTQGNGLSLLRIKDGSFRNFANDSNDLNSIGSNIVLCLEKENDSIFWIGTLRTGLDKFNMNSGKFEHFRYSEKMTNSISSNYVYSILKTRDGSIFIGTQGGGLNLFNSKDKTFKSWKNEPANPYSISSNDIQAIYEDEKGLLWLGTNGGGLNAFDRKTGRTIRFTEKQGFPSNLIYSIGGDTHGSLWLTSNKGLIKFTASKPIEFSTSTPETHPFSIRNFTTDDGLSSNEFNQGKHHKDNAGNMYFGNLSGVTVFHPDSISQNSYNPPVIFTNFKVFEKNYPLDSIIQYKKCIVLSYSQDFFSFEFAGLNYLLPEKNTYAVMMKGFDKDWIYTGTRRFASYTNLDPGDYTFLVKAANNDGVWGDQYASVNLLITPPFWRTWWFKTLSLGLFLFTVYSVYVIRVRQIKKEEERKTAFNKELAEVEMKALRAQMNPHFIFNSLNSINKYIWANDQRKASEYLTRFSKLIRLILENSRHQAIALDKDLEGLELYMQMESLRFEQHFEYHVELSDTIEAESILIPPLLLQPFVENSIWHGLMPKETAGTITIKISVQEENLHCMIEDNGIGRLKAAEIKAKKISNHNSLGMKVTMERIAILNQQKNRQSNVIFTDLYDTNGMASGTRVELSIPLEYSF